MAYQVLARKSRPQDFDSLIGQEVIVQALRNGITEGRIAQAYLFSGIRGVGKTSAARVLAKALNCEQGPSATPCNECQICREITAGGDLDVIEVDAATYSKVEQVRELTESLRYGPARDRYKVVILDEVHRLSRQAFDALLKIIEEPPPHLVFVFATTEIEAVPATILSRCQEFRFRRVPSPVLAAHLRRLCDQEGIEASDPSLLLIARAGDGSVRDSVALLDQLATFGAGTISDTEASRLLGGFDSTLFRSLLTAILQGDSVAVTEGVHSIEEEGRDPRHVFAQFLGYCRDALHLAMGSDPAHLDLPEEDRKELEPLARQAGYESLLRVLNLLLASEATVRRSEAGALALEIAWLRAAELPKLTSLEDLLSGRAPAPPVNPGQPAKTSVKAEREVAPRRKKENAGESGVGASADETPKSSVRKSSMRKEVSDAPRKIDPPVQRPTVEEPAGREEPPLPEPPPDLRMQEEDFGQDSAGSDDGSAPDRNATGNGPLAAGAATTGEQGTAAFLEGVGRRKQPLLVRLKRARRVELEAEGLIIHLDSGDSSLRKVFERSSNRRVIEEALKEVRGQETPWRLVESEAPSPKEAEETSGATGDSDEETTRAAAEDPRVQRVLDIFGGSVENIVQHEGEGE